MLEKAIRVLKAMRWIVGNGGSRPTVGEVAKRMKMSKSTVRRVMLFAEKNGLVEQELVKYKSTGKRVFEISEKGFDLIESQKELF